MMLEKDGENVMVENEKLSNTAKKFIGGLMKLAAPLTAFGNTIPTSYLRLVPHQEAPTNICWGDRNRSVLVRVPLGWLNAADMIHNANPVDKSELYNASSKQTVEFRAGDGSADIYSFLAALVIAGELGLTSKDSLEIANSLYVDTNIFDDSQKELLASLKSLPESCWESAVSLEKTRNYFEKGGIFPKGQIDNIINHLKSHNDNHLNEELYGNSDAIMELVEKYLHCM
jgi:glutamine synthetase